MTRHFAPPTSDALFVPALLVAALRCWRQARDMGMPVLPCLSRTLGAHDSTMLAPAFASLCLFYELALGRRMTVGDRLNLSHDEHLMLAMVDGTPARHCFACKEGAATAFEHALRSARIMLALDRARPAARPFTRPAT